MKPIVITDAADEENFIPFTLPGGKTVQVPRLDYLDEDTFDALNSDLEALDVEQQLIAVANDIASAKPGTKLQWMPLMELTKQKLAGFGVEIARVTVKDSRYDEVCAPTDEVVAALKPYSEQRALPLRKRGREIALTMLKHAVAEEDYALFEPLRVGQLDRILSQWRKHSSVTLGE